MSDQLPHLHALRALNALKSAPGVGNQPAREVQAPAPGQPPPQHLANVLLEAQSLFEKGEWTKGVESLCHAVFVAATTGKQGLTDTELIHQLRRITGFHFDPGEAA